MRKTDVGSSVRAAFRAFAAPAGFFILATTVTVMMAPSATAQSQPVLVRDTENPAHHPFTYRSGANWIANAPNASFFVTVPAGKRLVIEQVSFRADVKPSATQKVSVEVLTTTAGVSSAYFFAGASRGPAGVFDEFIGAAQMRSYADANGFQEILVTRADSSGGGADNVDLSLSGYLVDMP
jgi:hypothetical protein